MNAIPDLIAIKSRLNYDTHMNDAKEPLAPEDVSRLLAQRKTARNFSEEPLPREMISRMIADASQAPNSCNHQMWKFIVVDDPEIRKRLHKEAKGNPIISRAPAVVVLTWQMGWNHNKHSTIQSLGAAGQNLLLSAHSRGLSAVWIAGIGKPENIRKILNIPAGYFIAAYICLGKPKGFYRPKPDRRPVNDILSFNHFDFPAHLTFPMRIPGKGLEYEDISNTDNPCSVWSPSEWSLDQIREYRSCALWATGPETNSHMSKRYCTEFRAETKWMLERLDGNTLAYLPGPGSHLTELGRLNKEFGKGITFSGLELSRQSADYSAFRFEKELSAARPAYHISPDGTLPAEATGFDSALVTQSLEHLPAPEKALDTLADALRPKGNLLLSFRNLHSWFFISYLRQTRGQVWNQGPYKPLSYRAVLKMLRSRFRIREIAGLSPLPSSVGKQASPFTARFSRLVLIHAIKTP